MTNEESLFHTFEEQELSKKTIDKIDASLKAIKDEDCIEFIEQIQKLIEKYNGFPSTEKVFQDEQRSLKEVLSDARLPRNILAKTKAGKGYKGPNLESCIKLGLAIGCECLSDIDLILIARGFATLTEGKNRKYTKYRTIVNVLLAEDELLPSERVNIFCRYTE